MLGLLGVVGCGAGGDASEPRDARLVGNAVEEIAAFPGSGRIEIVCTTGMVADVVRNVGGEHVAEFHAGGQTFEGPGDRLVVRQLYGPGVDPHTHRPTSSDVETLASAHLVVFNGLHLEGTLADVLDRRSRRRPTYAVTRDLPPEKLLVDDSQHDPHVWMDVSLWQSVAANVAAVLSRLDPPHAQDYATNLAAYERELDELHTYAKERIAEIPEERRVIVTAHDAFAYFARAYGMEVRSIQGLSTESEASVRDVNELVEFLVERKVKAVFVETSVSDRNTRALVEGCRRKGHEVTIGGKLYSDAMGEPGTTAGTYVGMIRHNVDVIVEASK